MSYLDLLKDVVRWKNTLEGTDKTARSAFVSFDSTPRGHFSPTRENDAGRMLDPESPPLCPDAEDRRARAVAFLDANPNVHRALVTDSVGDPESVIVTIAIRGRATGEVSIPRANYDAPALMKLLDKAGALPL